jgi:hypothetical protein
MIDTQKFIGLSELEARILATKAGLRINVVTDNVPTMLTNSMQMDRITLEVRGGFVTGATVG